MKDSCVRGLSKFGYTIKIIPITPHSLICISNQAKPLSRFGRVNIWNSRFWQSRKRVQKKACLTNNINFCPNLQEFVFFCISHRLFICCSEPEIPLVEFNFVAFVTAIFQFINSHCWVLIRGWVWIQVLLDIYFYRKCVRWSFNSKPSRISCPYWNLKQCPPFIWWG